MFDAHETEVLGKKLLRKSCRPAAVQQNPGTGPQLLTQQRIVGRRSPVLAVARTS